MQKEVNYLEKDDEIDVTHVFLKIKRALNRRKKLFFIFLFLGILLGAMDYIRTPKAYKSRMIISSSLFQAPSFVLILENLKELIEEGNSLELAKALNTDEESVRKINQIDLFSAKNYAQEVFGENITFKPEKVEVSADMEEEFVIEATVTDKAAFKILEEGIVHYLNSNATIKENLVLRQKDLNDMKNHIHRQRLQLDSLKRALSSIMSNENVPKDIYISSPGSMYTDMISLFNTEVKLTDALLASKINVIDSFQSYKRHHRPKLLISLASFICIFLALYIATVIYLEGIRETKSA